MSNIETFAVIGGDLRSAYLAGALAADGYKVITSGFDSTDLPPCVTGCTNPAQAASLADFVILPLPVTTDASTLNAPFSRVRITLDQVLNSVGPEQKLAGGSVSEVVRKEAEKRGLTIYDYFSREELAIHNSVPTAEGAIQLAMEETPITISGARCLITGYGRIGRTLARLLVALGADVTVAARKFADLAWATTQGCAVVEMEHMADAGDFDVIFNTVPVMLFDRELLTKMDRGTLLIDLASRPGGVDFNAAAELQIKTIWALSLPGRVAPKSSGLFIKNTILNMIKEGI
ncbi:MAG: dipicolinate synthase subunit DpsA [Clostridiales bacterium]|jgi:dipicolinate synthase subunit A|nr:dipicolinate synthase subunit DpsA [Clostridiales bacterium]